MQKSRSRRKFSSGREARGLAPVLPKSAPLIRVKKKARGRPFPKGNQYGLHSRFQPGQPSANPAGRPSSKKQSEACRAQLADIVHSEDLKAHRLPSHLLGKTFAEANAWVLEQEALRGNIGALCEIADRTEGKSHTSLSVDAQSNPLAELVASMSVISHQIGPPEEPAIEPDTETGE